jgi:SepF-like predicted cell division protein (DUF552 family)
MALAQVRIVAPSDNNEKMGEGNAVTVKKASIDGLAEAENLSVEISFQNSEVHVTINGLLRIKANLSKMSSQQLQTKHFFGLTALSSQSKSLTELSQVKLSKAAPAYASTQLISPSIGSLIDAHLEARLTGEIRVTLLDACKTPTSLIGYLPETLLAM